MSLNTTIVISHYTNYLLIYNFKHKLPYYREKKHNKILTFAMPFIMSFH